MFFLWSVGLVGISEVQRSLRRWDPICPCGAMQSIAELKQQLLQLRRSSRVKSLIAANFDGIYMHLYAFIETHGTEVRQLEQENLAPSPQQPPCLLSNFSGERGSSQSRPFIACSFELV